MAIATSLKNRFSQLIDQLGGFYGDATVSELHGRFYSLAERGILYSGGMAALTSINNATFQITTTGATATPIVGIYNPAGSGVNAIPLQAMLGLTLTALTNTGAGPFVWAITNAAGPISTGTVPTNMKTLNAAGAQCKVLTGAALTGMTGTLAAFRGSVLAGGSTFNISNVDTAAGFSTIQAASAENFDGGLILPPNSVLALLGTATPVAHSAVSGIIFAEVPTAAAA